MKQPYETNTKDVKHWHGCMFLFVPIHECDPVAHQYNPSIISLFFFPGSPFKTPKGPVSHCSMVHCQWLFCTLMHSALYSSHSPVCPSSLRTQTSVRLAVKLLFFTDSFGLPAVNSFITFAQNYHILLRLFCAVIIGSVTCICIVKHSKCLFCLVVFQYTEKVTNISE